jgi:ribose 5-phosphate isomerase A
MDPAHDQLAIMALAPVRSGMTVGLGTGRAAARGIRTLAHRARAEGLRLTCVSTSLASAQLATELGLRVVELPEVDRVDLLFDGADEVDPDLHMLKGGGGAMTREKIVAEFCLASGGRTVYLIDESKLSPRLGTLRRLPIEVIRMAVGGVRRALERRGLEPQTRVAADGSPVLTDQRNLILDATLPPAVVVEGEGLAGLSDWLDRLTGVVDHGLFLSQAQELLIERPSGIERRGRAV